MNTKMNPLQIAILSIALIGINGTPITSNSPSTRESEEKTKRDLSIVGPIPSNYQGQATGQTTFDGIAAEDLTLPVEPGHVQIPGGQESSSAHNSDELARSNRTPEPQQNGFRTFQRIGHPSANFNPQQSSVFDFDHTNLNLRTNPRPINSDNLETTVDGIVATDLSLPQATHGAQNGPFLQESRVEDASVGNGGQEDTFDPQTPSQRHDRLSAQYADLLSEYRSSLTKFNEELDEYSEVKAKRLNQRQ